MTQTTLVTDADPRLPSRTAKAAATAANDSRTGLPIVDGYQTVEGDRVLLLAETLSSARGLWVAHSGAWTRPLDFKTGADVGGAVVWVRGGTKLAGRAYQLSGTAAVLVDTDSQTWTQVVPTLPLVPTAVKTSGYGAAVGELVPVDTTGGAVTVTLPTAPVDGARVAVKHVIQGTSLPAVTVACGGSDVFDKAGGPATLTLPLVNQTVSLQYQASGAVWTALTGDVTLAPAVQGRPKSATTTYLTLPGCRHNANVSALLLVANTTYYERVFVDSPITFDLLYEITVAAASGKLMRMGIASADANWEPVALVGADSGDLAADATPAVYTALSTRTLQPGKYLFMVRSNGAPTLRFVQAQVSGGGMIAPTIGTSPFITQLTKSETYAAFSATPTAWDTVAAASGTLEVHTMFAKVTTP